jgi:hypothetical protein
MTAISLSSVVAHAATPLAYVLDLNTGSILEHPHDDLGSIQPTGASTSRQIYAMESAPDGGEIWAIDAETSEFGTLDPDTGVFSVIGTAMPSPGHSWTGLTANRSGTWALSTNGAVSTLYSLDSGTGAVTAIGSQSTAPFLIDLAVTCDGRMFGHDISTDSLYSIDPQTGAATLIGPTGFDARFAQGMTVNRETDEIFGYLFTFEDDALLQYGFFDTNSGALQVIGNSTLEMEAATTTACERIFADRFESSD